MFGYAVKYGEHLLASMRLLQPVLHGPTLQSRTQPWDPRLVRKDDFLTQRDSIAIDSVICSAFIRSGVSYYHNKVRDIVRTILSLLSLTGLDVGSRQLAIESTRDRSPVNETSS